MTIPCHSVVPNVSASAAMCSGVVPQQPPTIDAPSETHVRASSRYCAGVVDSYHAANPGREIGHIRIGTKWHVCEGSQILDRAGNIVAWKTIYEQRIHADLLKTVRGVPKQRILCGLAKSPRGVYAYATRISGPLLVQRSETQSGSPVSRSVS